MKILWLTEFFPKTSKGEITGGVEARCFFVSKYLHRQGYQLTILSRSSFGGRWDFVSWYSLFDRLLFWPKIITAGLKIDFDVVEGTNIMTFFPAFILGKIKHHPVVYWYPDILLGSWLKLAGFLGFFGEILERLSLWLPADKYLAISHSVEEKLLSHGILKNKISLIPCGFDPEETGKIKIPREKKYDLCVVSRLVGYKQVDLVIEAAALLKRSYPQVKVTIIGQGPERHNLEKLVGEYRLGKNIDFLGHLPAHKQVLQTIAASRLLVHPSSVEGFGIIIVEAAALGVPSIASDLSVIREVTDNGQGGLLFKVGQAPDLAEKIKYLLNNEDVYQQKSSAARKMAAKYSWERIAGETAKIYESLLSH